MPPIISGGKQNSYICSKAFLNFNMIKIAITRNIKTVIMNLILSDRPLHLPVLTEDIRYFDLSALKIANCVGCFGCWTKTPGRCVIRDDATRIYPCIAASDTLLYVSRLCYGGYDTIMKTMLERAIPVQQAFIRVHCRETHHVQRAVVPKKATIIVYADTEIEEEERRIFRQLVIRNAYNMNFESFEILFTTESQVNNLAKEFVTQWERF